MTNQVDISVGRKMRRLRMFARFSLAEMAAEIDIDVHDLEQIEGGASRAGSELLDRMSRLVGVPVWSFFDNADEIEADNSVTRALH